MLSGDKVLLRPLRMSDIEKVNLWRNDLDITRLTMGIRFPKTIEMDEEWFNHVLRDKSNKNVYWAIDIQETEECIGIVSLTNIDYVSGTCFFGRVIGEQENRGKGFGREVSRIVYDYAFNCLNIRKIIRYIVEYNHISLGILKNRAYEKEEGRLRKHFYFDGQYHDVIIMALFREDYYKSTSQQP